jgi:hypothetical protein
MSHITNGRSVRRRHHSSRRAAAVLGITAAAGLVAAPAVAQAASRSTAATHVTASVARPAPASSFCASVSAAAVAGITGWSVSTPSPKTYHNAASASDDGVASTEYTCVYGHPTSLAALAHLVTLETITANKALTGGEIQALINKALASAAAHKIDAKFTAYPGLGAPAWYMDFSNQEFSVRGIIIALGSRSAACIVETSTLATSKIAALAKLAEKL